MSEEGQWRPALRVADLERGWVAAVTVDSRTYAIYDAPEGIFASLAHCTHEGALLCDGYFDGHTIECPLHQGCFDVRTGRATGAPATRNLRTFETRVVDGMVELKLPRKRR